MEQMTEVSYWIQASGVVLVLFFVAFVFVNNRMFL